ncbi:MAG: peptidylprolyl isomerase [Actinobacteria bacterium]|nr:peptidylprolyl isomerase [Actinomycetota bacterium]
MAAPVQRKGGSTRRPRAPRIAPAQKKKGSFTPGVIATLLVLVLLGTTAVLVGSGAFTKSATPLASPSNTPSPSASPSGTPTTAESTTSSSAPATTAPNAPSPSPSASSAPTSASSAAPTTISSVNCTYTRSSGGNEKFTGLPPAKATPGTRTATVVTNRGTIVMQLNAAAPCTGNSFAFLASKSYFDGTKCHRLLNAPGFTALQCGDPSATGSGGPGYAFADENLAGATYPRGTLAMANAGAGTNGSQFFFVFKDSQFSPNYTPFGKVVSGLDVLDAIAAEGTDNGQSDGAPKKTVTLSSVRIQ